MKIKILNILFLLSILLFGCNTKKGPTKTDQEQSNLGRVTPDPKVSPIIISNVIHDDNGLETILITNMSDEKQDIHGYTVLISSTTEHINILNVSLEPGESFKVYNGPGAKDQADGLAWLDHAVLQEWGDDLTLLNGVARVVWTYVYYP